MARRYIGYGMTNEHGVATLDYDANGDAISGSGYTGVGAGKIDFQAELHDDSSVVSQPITIWDTLWYDKSDATWSNGTYASFSNGVRTFNNTSSGEVNIYANNDNTFTGDLICEFDVNSFSTDFYLRFYVEFGRNYISSTDLSISENNHVMIKVLDKNCAMYVNGTLKKNFDFTSNGIELGFRLSVGGTLNISNYKVYSI